MMTPFEPQLVLTLEPDGEYTLHAVTIAPNSCYAAGRAERGVPPEVRLLPEAEPVLLHLRHRSGPCLQVLKPVRHCLHDLHLGQAAGKTTLVAFVMLDGRTVGSASLDTSQLGKVTPGDGKDPPRPLDTSDWYAWTNRMPGSAPAVHVTGVVLLPTPGYAVALEAAAPQGINPRDLILDLKIERQDGVWPQVVTSFPARYDGDAGPYETVLVRLPDGASIQLQVETVY